MSNDKGSGFFNGFFLGGIIGIIVAVFFLRNNGEKGWKTKIMDLAELGRKTVLEAIDEGKQAASQKEAQIRGEFESKDD